MKQDNMNTIDEAIARLFAREQDYADMLKLNEWLNENPRNREELETLGMYWKKESDELSDAEASFAANRNNILGKSGKPLAKKWLRYALASCAALAIFLLGGLLSRKLASPERIHNYTAQGAVCHFELPDGSEVDLNKGADLQYCEKKSEKERQVTLTGEAFFNVRHDSAHPFIVRMGDARIRVLGTKFNVRCGMKDNLIVATLSEGKIEFRHKNNVIDIAPNEQLVYDITSGETNKSMVDVGRFSSWTEGLFRYKSITLGELAEELSVNYGRKVLIDPSLKDVVMSGAFRRDQSLEDILRILQSCLDVNWKYNDDIVYLSSK